MADDDENGAEKLEKLIKRFEAPRPRPHPRVAARPRTPTLIDAVPPPARDEALVAPGDPRAELLDAGWSEEEPTRDLRPAHLRGTPREGDRDSQVHVHVHQAPKTPSLRPSDRAKAIVQSDWAKLIIAVILGVTGGGAGHVVAKNTEPDAASKVVDLERELEAVRKDVRALKLAASSIKTTVATQKKEQTAADLALYELGRYVFNVLPQMGVNVYIERGREVPPAIEFLPAPLARDSVGPNDAKPIQPREAFPMPDKP